MNESILNCIGNTPLVNIRHLNPNPNVTILAKLEYMNPGGSIKDRVALAMIEAGEKSGELTKNKTVIEATSGNTGIGLALVCAVKGYRLLLVMSEAVSLERRKILKARGADILLTPGHLGTDGAIEEVYRMLREQPDAYFITDQFNNEANWQAHYHGTAEEIWQQTNGRVDTIVSTMGTTGTLMGLQRRLKELNPKLHIIGVEPYLGHKIQGLKNMKEAYQPEIYDKDRLDYKINIDDEDAFEMSRRLAKEEGLFVGMSSGAAMAVACNVARDMEAGQIVVILPDGGERYLSTPLFAERETIQLKFYNTLKRCKAPFAPIIPGKVSMYSCGPTAYAELSFDECRRVIFSDLLSRYLSYRGFSVQHVMNITDLDDNTIECSDRAGEELTVFTQKYIDSFMNDFSTLGVKPAEIYPKASEHVDDMIQLANVLVKKGFAYEKLRSVYFDISRFKDYGRLSGIDLNKIRLGATVDLDEYEKDNPRDFTLLKRCKLSELKRGIFAKTEWGNVRPSWHLQCAAMSMRYLSAHFDIHTSHRELIFPHHENEIAISKAATGESLANFWLHCDGVMVDGKRGGKKETPYTIAFLQDQGYTGKEIRYWLLATHYRKPVKFSLDRLESAKRSLKRWQACLQALYRIKDGQPYPDMDQLLYDIKNGFLGALDDDLNISAALAAIFKQIKKINTLISARKIDDKDAQKILDAFRSIDTVLNVLEFEQPAIDLAVAQLIKQRDQARRAQNWELADKLRQQLMAHGIQLRDEKI